MTLKYGRQPIPGRVMRLPCQRGDSVFAVLARRIEHTASAI